MHGAAPPVYPCFVCGQNFNNIQAMHQHVTGHAPQTDYQRITVMNDAAHIYRKNYLPPFPSLELTLGRDLTMLREILAHEAVLKRYAKCSFAVTAEFVKKLHTGEVHKSITIYLKSKTFVLTPYQDHDYFLRRCHAEIAVNSQDFVDRGSDWILNAVFRTELLIVKCKPLQGGCGQAPVVFPKDVLKFRQVTANDDNACFFRCVARHFVNSDDKEILDVWVSQNLDTAGFDLPFRVDKIREFERRHSETLNMKINLLYMEEGDFYPIFASRESVTAEHVNILLYHQSVRGPDGKEVIQAHYAYIANLGKLLRKTYPNNNAYASCAVCPNCLNRFNSARVRDEHFANCQVNVEQRVKVPMPGEKIEFRDHVKKFRMPLVSLFHNILFSVKANSLLQRSSMFLDRFLRF